MRTPSEPTSPDPPSPTSSATVQAELPTQLFRVITDEGTTLIAGLSAEAKRLGVAISIGSRVEVRAARLDPGRGTILGPLAPPPARRQ
jgi:translation initiation factor IF-1